MFCCLPEVVWSPVREQSMPGSAAPCVLTVPTDRPTMCWSIQIWFARVAKLICCKWNYRSTTRPAAESVSRKSMIQNRCSAEHARQMIVVVSCHCVKLWFVQQHLRAWGGRTVHSWSHGAARDVTSVSFSRRRARNTLAIWWSEERTNNVCGRALEHPVGGSNIVASSSPTLAAAIEAETSGSATHLSLDSTRCDTGAKREREREREIADRFRRVACRYVTELVVIP